MHRPTNPISTPSLIAPNNHPQTQAWNDFAALEKGVGESERARAIYELAIAQPALDMPEASAASLLFWGSIVSSECSTLMPVQIPNHAPTYPINLTTPQNDQQTNHQTLWKAYIDFELEEGEEERTRTVYERLLERTQHVKVWISFAQFEANDGAGVEVRFCVFVGVLAVVGLARVCAGAHTNLKPNHTPTHDPQHQKHQYNHRRRAPCSSGGTTI